MSGTLSDVAHISLTHDFRCPACGGRYHSSSVRDRDEDYRLYICTSGSNCRWEGSAAECFTVPRLTPEKHLPPYLRRRVPTLSDSQIGHVDGPEAQAFTDLPPRSLECAYRHPEIQQHVRLNLFLFFARQGSVRSEFERALKALVR